MTLEDKAREIAEQIASDCIGILDGKANLYSLDAADYIVAALLSTRNEALEEAAKVAEEEALLWDEPGSGWAASTTVATRIRALKEALEADAIRALK